MSILIISLITVLVTAAIAIGLEFMGRSRHMGSAELALLLLSYAVVNVVMTVGGSIIASLGWWSLLVLPCTLLSTLIGALGGFMAARPLWKIKTRLFPRKPKGKKRRPILPMAPTRRVKAGQ